MAAADIVAAVRRAGHDNPLLGIDAARQPPAGTPAAELCANAGDAAAGLVDAVGAWLGIRERRVAASLVVLGYAARLVGPAVAVLLRDGILLDVRPAQVRYTFVPGGGFRLSLPQPAGWRGSAPVLHRRWQEHVIDEHLRPLIASVRGVVPVAAGLLWGNVASGLTGALRALAGTVPADLCHRTGLTLLRHPALAGSGRLALDAGQLAFTRRSCCLYYRIDGGGTCGDCPLSSPRRSTTA
ncbi:ferric iron reductase [Planosporangium thailandense]|uniref:Ferric iron reductase n=1 Tax=Planosporangium thailandense TaxID=765197 RepID=A0ABX0XYJ4_9ACTN|nr:ferric iron reductase [Planosporangium thailandense]